MAFRCKFSVRGGFRLSALVSLGVLATSCSDSKVAQCNKLIEVANQAVTAVQTVTQKANPDNVEAMNEIADAADKAKADMTGLKLGDENLQKYQQRFVSMYTDTSKATRDLVTAANSKDATSAQKAFESLKTATDQEAPLVEEVNKYCTAK